MSRVLHTEKVETTYSFIVSDFGRVVVVKVKTRKKNIPKLKKRVPLKQTRNVWILRKAYYRSQLEKFGNYMWLINQGVELNEQYVIVTPEYMEDYINCVHVEYPSTTDFALYDGFTLDGAEAVLRKGKLYLVVNWTGVDGYFNDLSGKPVYRKIRFGATDSCCGLNQVKDFGEVLSFLKRRKRVEEVEVCEDISSWFGCGRRSISFVYVPTKKDFVLWSSEWYHGQFEMKEAVRKKLGIDRFRKTL